LVVYLLILELIPYFTSQAIVSAHSEARQDGRLAKFLQ